MIKQATAQPPPLKKHPLSAQQEPLSPDSDGTTGEPATETELPEDDDALLLPDDEETIAEHTDLLTDSSLPSQVLLEEHDENYPLPVAAGKYSPHDSLHLYLQEISKFPLLSPEDEYALAKLVREHNDTDAAFRLVSSHLRLVVRIAMDF